MNYEACQRKSHEKDAYGVDYNIAHPAIPKRDEG